MLELDATFAENKTRGTLVKIAYAEANRDAKMIKLFINHYLKSENSKEAFVSALKKGQIYYAETNRSLM